MSRTCRMLGRRPGQYTWSPMATDDAAIASQTATMSNGVVVLRVAAATSTTQINVGAITSTHSVATRQHSQIVANTGPQQQRRRQPQPGLLKPNSITLSGRRQVRSWSQTCSELEFGLMEFGFEPVCDPGSSYLDMSR